MINRGDILDGKYELLKLIGRGGMSKVWLAMDTHLNKQWAVKEIDKNEFDCWFVSKSNPGQQVKMRVMLFNMQSPEK